MCCFAYIFPIVLNETNPKINYSVTRISLSNILCTKQTMKFNRNVKALNVLLHHRRVVHFHIHAGNQELLRACHLNLQRRLEIVVQQRRDKERVNASMMRRQSLRS